MSKDPKIARINELSRKSKAEGLNSEEKVEQAALREEYINGFRNNLRQTLDNVVLVDEEGNKSPLKKCSSD